MRNRGTVQEIAVITMKVIMVWPAIKLCGFGCHVAGASNEAALSDHGLAMIASNIEAVGHRVQLLDMRGMKGWPDFENAIINTEYDIACIGFHSVDEEPARKAVETMKRLKPDKPIIAGGIHLTITHARFPPADCVVYGEGDIVIRELLFAIEHHETIPETVEAQPIDNLDILPIMDRTVFNQSVENGSPFPPGMPQPFFTMVLSRGCWYKRCSFCLTDDNDILTSVGIMNIKDVCASPQDEFKLYNHEKKWETPIRFYKREYNGDLISITGWYNNISIIGTPDHKLKVMRQNEIKDIGMGDIQSSDRLIVPILNTIEDDNCIDAYRIVSDCGKKMKDGFGDFSFFGGHKYLPYKINITKLFCRLIGYYLSEGHISTCKNRPNSHGLHFTFNENEIEYIEEVESALKELGCNSIRSHIESCHTIQVQASHSVLSMLFKSLFGTGSRFKRFPKFMLHWPNERLMEILKAYYFGDGTKDCRITTVSKSLAIQLWLILHKLGLVGGLYRKVAPQDNIQGRVVNHSPFIYGIDLVQNGAGDGFGSFVWGKSYIKKHRFKRRYKNREILRGDDFIYMPIRKIDRINDWNGYVYNINMNDKSYIVNGYVSKNCYESNISTPRYRLRSPEKCVAEIKSLKAGSIMFHDDIFPHKAWCEKFIRLWKEAGIPRIPFWTQMRADQICKSPETIESLAEIGLTWVSLGVESNSQRMLDFLEKGTTIEMNKKAIEILHENNVNCWCNLVFGLPTETKEDIEATIKLLEETRPAFYSLSTYTCYPGSKLYKYCEDNELFTDDHYSMARYPYERCILGVDYNYLRKTFGHINTRLKGPMREWKPKEGKA